jgi:hypothetical protein
MRIRLLLNALDYILAHECTILDARQRYLALRMAYHRILDGSDPA